MQKIIKITFAIIITIGLFVILLTHKSKGDNIYSVYKDDLLSNNQYYMNIITYLDKDNIETINNWGLQMNQDIELEIKNMSGDKVVCNDNCNINGEKLINIMNKYNILQIFVSNKSGNKKYIFRKKSLDRNQISYEYKNNGWVFSGYDIKEDKFGNKYLNLNGDDIILVNDKWIISNMGGNQ